MLAAFAFSSFAALAESPDLVSPAWLSLDGSVTAYYCFCGLLCSSSFRAGFFWQAAGSGQRAAGSGQRAAGSGQRAAGSGQRAAGSRAAGSGQLGVLLRILCMRVSSPSKFSG